MATTSSPAVFAISASSGSPLKAKRYNDSTPFYSQNAFRYNPLSTRPSIPRKSCRVRATVLQDNEEKVVVEESFPVKTSPDNGGKGGGREPPESSSLERWVIKIEQSVNIFLTDSVIKILDTLYRDRNYARFFVLETIARVPYFGFMSVLHMYESFGWWRRADYLKVHFAESWNEMHHLLIMEELGGNAWWVDRFLAQHIAIFYYFMTVLMYVISPRMAYHFSECVERHAFETYDKFIKAQGGELEFKQRPKETFVLPSTRIEKKSNHMEVERVQALAIGGLKELPEQFIRPAHERPENSKAVEGVTVPVISLSLPHDVLVEQVAKACHDWGFFLVTDHGISPSLIQRLQEVGQEFFELPQEEKESYANDAACGKFEGYGTRMTKNDDQKVEWVDYFFHFMAPPSKVDYGVWPKNPPAYREVTEEYNKEMVRITDDLLRLLSEGLGLEGKVLKSILRGEEIELEMKINMYPPCPQPELALGVEPHTDMSALTLLVPNDVPGLQVSKDDNWIAVNYLPNALFVHVGDQLEVLSNGKYKSVLHRSLVNKERTRMSWAVFVVPPQEATIGPLAELVDDQNPAKYSTKTYAEYRHRKFNKLPQ